MSELGPFVAWLAFAWVLFVVGNSLSGLVDAWRSQALCRADRARVKTAAMAERDPSHDCDVTDCEVYLCESCGHHAHSVGTPANWAFDPEDSVYLCADYKDCDENQDGAT